MSSGTLELNILLADVLGTALVLIRSVNTI
jgi:hypothetical protein